MWCNRRLRSCRTRGFGKYLQTQRRGWALCRCARKIHTPPVAHELKLLLHGNHASHASPRRQAQLERERAEQAQLRRRIAEQVPFPLLLKQRSDLLSAQTPTIICLPWNPLNLGRICHAISDAPVPWDGFRLHGHTRAGQRRSEPRCAPIPSIRGRAETRYDCLPAYTSAQHTRTGVSVHR